MLVLTRKENESIMIGGEIEVKVLATAADEPAAIEQQLVQCGRGG